LDFSIFIFYFRFLKKNSPRNVGLRLGTVNDFYWAFKPVLSSRQPHTFSTFIGEENDKNALTLSTQAT